MMPDMLNLTLKNARDNSRVLSGAVGVAVLVGLYWSQRYNFLLFHCLAEGFSIAIACGTFMLAWNTRRVMTNNYLLFLGIAYLFIGGLDSVHTLAYKGMGIFYGTDANRSTQLWIAARLLESISMVLAPWWIGRRLPEKQVVWAYAVYCAVVLVAVFPMKSFPDCFIEGHGLTLFKITIEYLIVLVLVAALMVLIVKRRHFDPSILRLLVGSIILTMASEIAFTFYVSTYGLSNQIGHYLKIASYFLIYKAIIQTGLVRPHALLFRDLQQKRESLKAAHDRLEQRVEERTAELLSVSRRLQAEVGQRECAQQALIKANRMLKTLSECNQCLVRSADERSFLDQICSNIVQHGGYGYAAVAFTEKNQGLSLHTAAQAGKDVGFLAWMQPAGVAALSSDSPVGTVLKERMPRVMTIPSLQADFSEGPADTASVNSLSGVILPLCANDDTLGVLLACSGQADAFDAHQVRLLMELASDVSFGIVTLRMHQQRRVAEAERQLLMTAVEQAGDCICIIDKDAKIKYINPAIELISGAQRHTWFRRSLLDLFDDSRDFPLKTILERVNDGQSWDGRIKYRAAQGAELDLGIRLSPVRDASLRVGHLVAIIKDITRECQMEKQLFQSQKMEAIGTLAGGIAHDFNNILSAINGFTELTLDQIDKDSIGYRNLKEVLNAGHRATELVQQILTFSRQTTPERKPVALRALVEEAARFLRSSLPSTITIRQDLDSDGMVMAEPAHIHQILMNLGTNAAHAMHETGGLLTIALKDDTIDANGVVCFPEAQPGPYLRLTVCDTGHGMPQDVMDHIFEPFFTTKADGEGTGMGLSIVHGIVRSLDGIISVSSEPRKGTSFTVYLPAIERVAALQNAVDLPLPIGANEHILFVDDEPPLAEIGRQTLESLGYQVTIRIDGTEALDLIRAQPDRFDLVVTDMTMPGITGDNLAREIKAIRPRLPVILCSGFSTRMDGQRAAAIGISAYVNKPVLRGQLARIIREVLDKQRGRQLCEAL
jgi:PAS domain S-box-containing protein